MQALTRSTDFVLWPLSVFNIYSCLTSLLFHLFPNLTYNGFWHSLICCQKNITVYSVTHLHSLMIFASFTHVEIHACFLTRVYHIQVLSHLVFCILHSISTNTGFGIIIMCCGPSSLGLRPRLQGNLAPSSGSFLLRLLSQNLSSESKVALWYKPQHYIVINQPSFHEWLIRPRVLVKAIWSYCFANKAAVFCCRFSR